MESSPQAWSSTKTTFGKLGSDGKALAKTLTTLAAFLEAGLHDRRQEQGMQSMSWGWPLNHVEQHMISRRSNCFAYLNLFGPPPDEESQIYEDRGDRQRVFANRFQKPIELGLEAAKQGGGDVGRASARVQKAIKDGMKDFDGLD